MELIALFKFNSDRQEIDYPYLANVIGFRLWKRDFYSNARYIKIFVHWAKPKDLARFRCGELLIRVQEDSHFLMAMNPFLRPNKGVSNNMYIF